MADASADRIAGLPEGLSPREAIVITGPTASGKSTMAIALARRIGGEIISMDSRQVYRGMDIGTAKVTPEEQRLVPHHGIDLIDPDQRYSSGRFARDARRWIEEIRGRGRTPILVGGTGFFLHALIRPLFEEPELDPRRRDRLGRWLERQPTETLQRWLARLDPETAERLGKSGGRQRLMRAIEVALLSGRPLSWWHRNAPPTEPPLRAAVFVLDLPREELYRRINERVTAMIDAGLVEEVESLLATGFGPGDPGMSATGYPEIIAYLEGAVFLEEAADEIRQATRRYARRQLTWFRNQIPEAVWIDADRPLDSIVDDIVQEWTKEAP